ncbi:MAG: hypothetical protein KatS3mg009_2376 [Acidimicrobiia bacterium]|nr:MAG: hypothetical protein KatS3mg009_2376 [Acidimicrobiia bacterium]
MSWSEMWTWNDETPAIVPAGARISAGKFGRVARSFPNAALSSVKRSPTSCIPSPESPANLITTRSSCWARSVGFATSVTVDLGFRGRTGSGDHCSAGYPAGRDPVRALIARARRGPRARRTRAGRARRRGGGRAPRRRPPPRPPRCDARPAPVRNQRRRQRPSTTTSAPASSASTDRGGSATTTGTDAVPAAVRVVTCRTTRVRPDGSTRVWAGLEHVPWTTTRLQDKASSFVLLGRGWSAGGEAAGGATATVPGACDAHAREASRSATSAKPGS